MKSTNNIEKLIKRANAVPRAEMNRRTLNDIFEAQAHARSTKSAARQLSVWRTVSSKVGYVAAALLVVVSWLAVDLQKEVTALRDELEQARQETPVVEPESSVTLNLYLKEHQDVIARHASHNPVSPQPLQMRTSQEDLLYYELLDNEPELMHPGIIVRGPSSKHEIDSSKVPVISNGHTLNLSEAKEVANFDIAAPPWIHPYFKLDQIRAIEGRDALQLLYTNGIHSISLFEQSLDGQRGLEPKDFREYAVYCNEAQGGGIILAWRDHALSYVLIGNIEMAQLMDMARSISTER